MVDTLKPPFPYFGNKKRVAETVWNYLGDVDLYVEPFLGSAAVLLGRPHWKNRSEVVNDYSANLVNFWRAAKHDPEGVFKWCKDLVSEVDLISRNKWLIDTEEERREKLIQDPEYFDAKAAGWWAWGQSAWVGRGWCQEKLNKVIPSISNKGVLTDRKDLKYFRTVCNRLEQVKVVCGSWKRVLTDGVFSGAKSIGVFFDPPYSGSLTKTLYNHEGEGISAKVREWCLKHGEDDRFRIVLAGYLDEHVGKMPGWEEMKYTGPKSFVGKTKEGEERKQDGNAVNRHKETLWISPHCRKAGGLLGATAATARLVR